MHGTISRLQSDIESLHKTWTTVGSPPEVFILATLMPISQPALHLCPGCPFSARRHKNSESLPGFRPVVRTYNSCLQRVAPWDSTCTHEHTSAVSSQSLPGFPYLYRKL
ncbi:uncharacterized protein LOC106663908 [Cimex lectularius]|uniref:Uncharacterized protein n=1 Tax=Cimex lectularius TaxID=79782 RepID=A0A8I6RM33_CIMLE|nr:uncharacterized protein LOC106663908 [Cimex lectularius]